MSNNLRQRLLKSSASFGIAAVLLLNGLTVMGIAPEENSVAHEPQLQSSRELREVIQTGYASTKPYAEATYAEAVGEETAKAEAKYLVDNNLIQLVNVDDEAVVLDGEANLSEQRIYFNEIPVGTYKPVLKQEALDAGYIQTSENTINVTAGDSPIFGSSVGTFFKKEIALEATGYASTKPYAEATYAEAVGEETAKAEAKYLVDNNLIQLVNVDDETVVLDGEANLSEQRIYFNEIPVGTYKPVLKQEALDAGYIQTSENTLTVNEGDSPIFSSSVGIFFEKEITVATGYASTKPYAEATYAEAVGEETAKAEAKYLVDNNLIQLVNVDDETVVLDGEANLSEQRIYFNEIPVGTYKPVLKQEALDAGYIQTSENTLTVNEGDSPIFSSSVGIFFEKEIEVEPTGYASTRPYAEADYEEAVGEEKALADAQYLVDNNLIQLVNVDDETVVLDGEANLSEQRIYFNEIPVGTYKPVLKQEALDAGYTQTSENTITVTEGDSPIFGSSVGIFFEKEIVIPTGYASTKPYADATYAEAVGEETAKAEAKYLVDNNLIQLVNVDDETVVLDGEANLSEQRIYFNEIPVGTYKPVLKQEALDAGYTQTSENTITVTEGDSPIFGSSVGIFFEKEIVIPTGYASTKPYADATYAEAVGEETAKAEAKYLVDNNLIQLVNVDDETVVLDGEANLSEQRIYFNEIPVGTYKPVLKQEALDAGYIQTSENTLTVTEGDSPIFSSSVGIFFGKEYEVAPTGYASTKPYAEATYAEAVGEEQVAEDIEYLVSNNLIQLINVEDETIVIEGVLDDSDPLRIFFNEIPLGTYKPVLKQEALDAGYIQTSENTITVNEAPSPVFASSTGIFFEKEYEEPTGYASTAPYANQEYIDSVGQEVAAADAKYLVDNNLIQLINVEDETIVIEGVLDDSDPLRIFFNEIPLGTYKPVLKQEALDAGYIQTSENTITVNKAPSPVFASSTGVFFEKKVAAVTVELTQTEQTHNLTWNVLDDIDGYAIYRRAPGEDKMTLFTETTDTSYTYDVENTGYYFYKVYPFTLTEDGVKVLGKSANYVFARAVQPIAPVTNLKAVNKYNRFNDLTWDPVEGADGYAIYRMAPGEDKLSYHISNVRNGYTEEVTETGYYFYRVLAYRKNIDGTLTLSESIEYVYAYNDSSAAVNLGN